MWDDCRIISIFSKNCNKISFKGKSCKDLFIFVDERFIDSTSMNYVNRCLLVLIIFLCYEGSSQPYLDIANFNYQNFSATIRDNPAVKNNTEIYALGVFLPHELKSGNTLLFRINSELIQTSISPKLIATTSVSSISLPIGYQWTSENKKWKSVLIGIPKLATDFEETIDSRDFQYGIFFVENYKFNDKLQVKAGIYCNKEAFGPFVVPLLGVDWKASERLYFFGLLPTNYKIEYTIAKKKRYAGINFKALTRSFQLSKSQNNDYIRFDEVVLKGYAEYYLLNNLVAYCEIGHAFGDAPLQYNLNSDALSSSNLNYASVRNYPLLSFGIAYRIREN